MLRVELLQALLLPRFPLLLPELKLFGQVHVLVLADLPGSSTRRLVEGHLLIALVHGFLQRPQELLHSGVKSNNLLLRRVESANEELVQIANLYKFLVVKLLF